MKKLEIFNAPADMDRTARELEYNPEEAQTLARKYRITNTNNGVSEEFIRLAKHTMRKNILEPETPADPGGLMRDMMELFVAWLPQKGFSKIEWREYYILTNEFCYFFKDVITGYNVDNFGAKLADMIRRGQEDLR